MKSYRQFLQGSESSSRRPAIAIATGVFALAGIVLLLTSRASTNQIYIGPGPGVVEPAVIEQVPIGGTIVAPVRINSGTVSVNAVEAKLVYPANQLEFVSIDDAGGAFDINSPASGNANGVVTLSRGKVGGVTGDHLVAKVTFKVVAAGTAKLSFGTGTMLLASSNNQNIITATGSRTYELVSTTTPVPQPVVDGKVYLTPATIPAMVSSPVTVELRENSGTIGVNAAEIKISYPVDKLAFTSFDATGGAFDIDTPGSGAANGVITIARGRTGSVTGDQLIGKLKFTAKANGPAVLSIVSGASVLAATNQQNVVKTVAGATVNINSPDSVPAIPGDLNGDQTVNITDVSLLFANWNKTGAGVQGDVNKDAKVDIFDLSLLLARWMGGPA